MLFIWRVCKGQLDDVSMNRIEYKMVQWLTMGLVHLGVMQGWDGVWVGSMAEHGVSDLGVMQGWDGVVMQGWDGVWEGSMADHGVSPPWSNVGVGRSMGRFNG